MTGRILIADDERALLDVLVPVLERVGFVVQTAYDGEAALLRADEFKPDVIVLDVMMPQVDGREVCRRLRSAGNWTPVIMLTQVGGPLERTLSLQEGADDYINKPFDSGELIARIRALLRRARLGLPSLANAVHLRSGSLLINRQSRKAWLDECELPLKRKAFSVLEYLMSHPEQVITRDQLLDAIWGWNYPTTTRTVDVRIAELRKHLRDDPRDPRYIETVAGEGYRFLGLVEAS